eukprot:1432000-Pyramimonas_sp.AAC.1
MHVRNALVFFSQYRGGAKRAPGALERTRGCLTGSLRSLRSLGSLGSSNGGRAGAVWFEQKITLEEDLERISQLPEEVPKEEEPPPPAEAEGGTGSRAASRQRTVRP